MKTESSISIIRLDSILAIMFFVFAILKAANIIGWSWWWVTLPIWLPIAIFLCVSGFILLIAALIVLPDFIRRRYIKK